MRVGTLFIVFILILSVPLISVTAMQSDDSLNAQKMPALDKDKVKVIITFKDRPKTAAGQLLSVMGITQKDHRQNVKDKIRNEGLLKHEFTTTDSVSATITQALLDELEADLSIAHIELDRPVYAFLDQSVPLINADDTWSQHMQENLSLTGKGTTVCVIDTGIDYTHPDLGNCSITKFSLNGVNESIILESNHNYANSFDYIWNVTKPGYSNISVHFKNISLEYKGESGGADTLDRIIIYDKDMVEIAVYHGINGVIYDLWTPYSEGDTIYIQLVTDSGVTDYGFYIDSVLNGTTDTTYDWSNCSKTIAGWDFVNGDGDPIDDMGHGTHVAGIVAGSGTITGVAPDAELVAVKILDNNGSGWFSDIIMGIEYCTNISEAYNVSVISLSLGDGTYHTSYCDADSPSMSNAINTAVLKNISVVVATGNENPPTGIASPACYENVTRVGATSIADSIEYYTQKNVNFPDMLLAPGGNIYSSVPHSSFCTGNPAKEKCDDSLYLSLSGTSMATPHVSGAIALMVQAYSARFGAKPTPDYIDSVLNKTGVPIYDTGNTPTYLNFSRIDVLSAVLYINTPPEITDKYNNFSSDNSTIITANETDSIFFNVSVSAPVNYTWQLNGSVVGTNQDNWTFKTNYTTSGFWIVEVTAENDNGTRSVEWNVTINDVNITYEPINITDTFNNITGDNSSNITIAETDSIFFNITVNETVNYTWYFDGGEVGYNSDNYTLSTDFNDYGTHNITVNVSKDNSSNIFKWVVEILNTNRQPAITFISNISLERQNQTAINLSSNISDLDGDNLTINVSDGNITVVGHTLVFNYTETVTNKAVIITINDSELTVNQTIYINITDTILPTITIDSPENKTYNTTEINLTISSDEVLDWCAYSLNSGDNVTFNCTDDNNFSAIEGVNNITIFANDSSDNLNYSTGYFMVDIIFPNMTFDLINYTTNDYFYINFSVSEVPNSCILEWNGANETMTVNGSECYLNKTGIAPGTYNYDIYVNDSAGNMNASSGQQIQFYYCYVSVTAWSSCVASQKTRTHTLRSCETSIETGSCYSGGGGGSYSFTTVPEIEVNDTDNETINETGINESFEDDSNINNSEMNGSVIHNVSDSDDGNEQDTSSKEDKSSEIGINGLNNQSMDETKEFEEKDNGFLSISALKDVFSNNAIVSKISEVFTDDENGSLKKYIVISAIIVLGILGYLVFKYEKKVSPIQKLHDNMIINPNVVEIRPTAKMDETNEQSSENRQGTYLNDIKQNNESSSEFNIKKRID